MTDQPGDKVRSAGEGIQACGCIIFLLPILIFFVLFLYGAIAGMFH